MRLAILTVDANPIFATLVRQTLEDTERYQVIHTGRGEEALEIARRGSVRLAIVDFDLPDLPGLEVIRRMRAMRDDLVIVAVPVGGELSPADREALRIHDVLTKPFYLPDLVHRMDAALGPLVPEVEAAPLAPPQVGLPAPEAPSAEPPPAGEQPAPPLALEPAPPAWLAERDRASRYLSLLTQEAEAAAGLLTRAGQAWSFAGNLTPEQVRHLAQQIRELTAQEPGRGALARFIHLPGSEAEHMLYATGVVGDFVLSLLFKAGTPFGTIRRQAETAARQLAQVDPARHARPNADGPPFSRQPGTDPGLTRPGPPDEWAPEAVTPDRELPFLQDFDVPPPDPGEAPAGGRERSDEEPAGERPAIPSDWIPSGPRPASQLPFLDDVQREPSSMDGLEEPEDVMPEAQYQLDFSAVLVPRFPEHRLTGRLAEDLKRWVARLCVAWGWRADAIRVQPDHLRIRITLAPEVVPSRAVHRLRQDLSARILAAYPGVGTDLPSGRFWARGYLLASGTELDEEDIRTFIAETRRSQGLLH
jgi:DNA-binding response OmpR family regulator/REP element-mobilizing transposase RayT